ncbi:glycosyltransferase [uncultured Winogradskyella sp.]|uniref:glycosyltransferase n=1 Tax=uncultured Winogradskyella sp. TaxID=395353 RepID=UPI00260D33BF|nr:glycosyltransferase [uncultured Winogradskyella sp.]
MKVLQVIDTLKVGGAEHITVLLSNLLYERKVDAAVLILVEKGELCGLLNTKIPVFFLERKRRFDKKKLKEVSQLIDEYDLVHIHLKHNFRYVSLASRYFSKQNHKLIFHDHSHYFGVSKLSARSVKDKLFQSVFKPDYFIGVSQSNCIWARERLRLPEGKIFLLENTIAKQNVDEKQAIKRGIVIVSNISRVKNIDYAIRLAKHLNERLTIFGKIRDEDYFNELEELVSQLDYGEHVKFVHDCNNIQPELYNYKYAIHTSHQETGPLVLIEYLAQGLPFLAFATGQVFKTIKSELPQCFISKFNLESWSLKVKELDKLSSTSLEQVYSDYFSSNNYINRCLSIYQKVINS